MSSSCIFCRIATYELAATIVHDDEHTIAFRDLHPKAPTHILIIPKEHVSTVNDVEPENAEALGHLFLAARSIAEAEGLSKRGYRLVMNTGSDSGQTVGHIHLHLMGGRAMTWPPG
ncbi:MAG: histidine triad nucleotide-binding protein [Longimicrobiales bacterium]